MGLNKLASGIERTDQLVSLGVIKGLSREIHDEIEVLDRQCQLLWGQNYSLFLTGSLALCLRSGATSEFRETGDRSDIDLWIFLDTKEPLVKPPSGRRCEILHSSYRVLSRFDIVSVPWPPSHAKFSIKLFSAGAARRALTLGNYTLRVLRNNSLREVKKVDTYFGLNGTRTARILEEKIADGYLWRWRSAPVGRGDIYLTDLLSCLLIGNFLSGEGKFMSSRKELLSAYFRAIERSLVESKGEDSEAIRHLLGYYYSRFPRSSEAIFGKK